MELTQELKQQLAEQKKQCIFCKIISGEMESKVVFQDDKVIAMLDIYPAVKGHIVFMLKEHYPMPAYLPAEDFIYKFGLLPGLAGVLKTTMLSTGMNVFIAIGGAAGQQAPHFLVHLLPREKGDGFKKFEFSKGQKLGDDKVGILANNFPIMMQNHFKRNPANWHRGEGDIPGYLSKVYENSKKLYEDEKILCVFSENPVVPGHLEIYSKEESEVENLSQESSAHIFFAASLAATLVFEGLGAQGTNIILKSGESDDNTGVLAMHILPRKENDGANITWEPKPPSYDLNKIKNQIKEEMWKVKEKVNKKKKVVEEVLKISDADKMDEIRKAIESVKK
jgi:histidine triad (HIT) family protein